MVASVVRRRRWPLAAAVVALALIPAPPVLAEPEQSCPWHRLGVYAGADDPGGVRQFEAWLGRPVRYALDFLPHESWEGLAPSSEWISHWSEAGYRMTFSVPMLPDDAGTLAEGAAGAYDETFADLARILVANGQGAATIRLGWEFNGDWYRWSAAQDPGAFVAYWRRVVEAMRAVRGSEFAFEWSPVIGIGAVAPDSAYPGDRYVDYIGLDVYDQSWIAGWQDPAARWRDYVLRPYGLEWHRQFAAVHGKPMSYPEWGVATRSDGHGGGDSPYFVERMYGWMATNDVHHSAYFEYDAPDGRHRLMTGQFPQAASSFRALFGPLNLAGLVCL